MVSRRVLCSRVTTYYRFAYICRQRNLLVRSCSHQSVKSTSTTTTTIITHSTTMITTIETTTSYPTTTTTTCPPPCPWASFNIQRTITIVVVFIIRTTIMKTISTEATLVADVHSRAKTAFEGNTPTIVWIMPCLHIHGMLVSTTNDRWVDDTTAQG